MVPAVEDRPFPLPHQVDSVVQQWSWIWLHLTRQKSALRGDRLEASRKDQRSDWLLWTYDQDWLRVGYIAFPCCALHLLSMRPFLKQVIQLSSVRDKIGEPCGQFFPTQEKGKTPHRETLLKSSQSSFNIVALLFPYGSDRVTAKHDHTWERLRWKLLYTESSCIPILSWRQLGMQLGMLANFLNACVVCKIINFSTKSGGFVVKD